MEKSIKGLLEIADWHYGKYEQTHEEDYLNDGDFLTAVANMLKTQEPVVRCKDCKHWWKVNELCTHQRHVHGTVCTHECKAMDYCSDGERRDSE